ncbi:hypothetical protein [Geomicrobium sp. JCM 19038]|uniref:hypothetical protein n=1 Tax=Geomicrobium sp. JCM 19038 TaxID=1460635 RepID=UPI00187C005D|nr:hypothetical protein [Geomicrobium sp. JCM 19038]
MDKDKLMAFLESEESRIDEQINNAKNAELVNMLRGGLMTLGKVIDYVEKESD